MNVLAVEPGNAKALESREAAHGAVTIGLSGISKDYSGVAALTDVSVEFYAGEVHAVLGENGAGKSTLMGVISGVTQPDAGEIEFEGRRVSPMSPETAAALGISISYQHPAVLEDLSVFENLRVALPRSVFEGRAKLRREACCAEIRLRRAPTPLALRRIADERAWSKC